LDRRLYARSDWGLGVNVHSFYFMARHNDAMSSLYCKVF